MVALQRPGVFLEERPPLTINPGGTVSTSTGALIGAANRGPVTPVLVSSYAEFTKYFSDVSVATSPLSFQAFQYFANGGSRLYAVRVAGTGAAAATRTLTDRAGTPAATLVVNAANPGVWGNNLYVDINDTVGVADQFDLIVYYGGATSAYRVEQFLGLTMDPTATNYALTVVNNATTGSKYVELEQPSTPSTATAPQNNPSTQVGRQLTNGVDGAAPADSDFSVAISSFDSVLEPVNIGLPGATTAQQSLAVSYAQNRGDSFVVCELPTTVLTAADAITAAGALTPSSYGAVYWPAIVVADPASTKPGATRTLAPTGAVLGLIALTDTTRGIQKAPAGTSTRVAGALAPAVQLLNADLDSLNVAQVNAIRQLPGSGVVVMGARTLKQGSSDRYVPIRRVLNYVKANSINLSQFAVFEPNTPQLWRSGMLKGTSPADAYYVRCDATNNDATSSSQGVVNVEIGVSLISPAEFIVIKIGQFEGGASVTGG